MSEIKLGNKIKCKITGLTGIATARCEYINGCVQYCLTPLAAEGKYPESTYLDEKQLEVVDNGVTLENKRTGGPQVNSPRIYNKNTLCQNY